MKLKNMWKRFWTLDVHNHEGFTLVELIIVIAILAILSTGAIAGYSAYVTSANKTADKAMIAEIENVLTMAYYNGDINQAGQVILTADGVANADSMSAQLVNALRDAYGTNWATALKLKYNWQSNYADTSFAGNEQALLNKVDELTNALGGTLADYANGGGKFGQFMTENGLDLTEDAGGAAVLYVAQVNAGLKTPEQKQAFTNAITSNTNPGDMINALTDVYGGGSEGMVAALATVYALGEVYCMDNGMNATLNVNNIHNVGDAAREIEAFFGAAMQEANQKGLDLNAYLKDGEAAKDAMAYLDVMSTVNGSKNTIIDNGLGSFSNLQGMFEAYAAGGVMITIDIQDGIATFGNTLPQD